MKTNGLLHAIGDIRDDIILDANSPAKTAKKKASVKVIAVLVAIVLLSVTPVLAAADVDPAYQLLYNLSPEIAQSLKPVRMACEDNGIRMEVVVADVRGDTAEIYVAMRDLTGDRIDATTDLFDSYSINRPFDCTATCRQAGYDSETKTVTFLITITQWEGAEIDGKKLTFSASRILSNKTVIDRLLPEVDLAAADTAPQTVSADELLNRGGSWAPGLPSPEQFLPTGSEAFYIPTPGVQFTAMGFVGGQLHIQIYCEDILNTDNHCGLTLVDSSGETLHGSSISYWDAEYCGAYYEYVFAVGPDEIAGYQLHGDIVTCDAPTEGDWQITFPLH